MWWGQKLSWDLCPWAVSNHSASHNLWKTCLLFTVQWPLISAAITVPSLHPDSSMPCTSDLIWFSFPVALSTIETVVQDEYIHIKLTRCKQPCKRLVINVCLMHRWLPKELCVCVCVFKSFNGLLIGKQKQLKLSFMESSTPINCGWIPTLQPRIKYF